MIIKNKKPLTLEQFADAHGIDLVVEIRDAKKYVAMLKGAAYKDQLSSGMSSAYWGMGSTPSQAIKNLASQINEKILVRHARSDLRTSIVIPKLKF